MRNLFKNHYVLIVLGFWLTILTCLSSCSSMSHGGCYAYQCVDVEITD